MKKKIKISTPDGKSIEKEIVVRDIAHFQTQLNNRTQTIISKKAYKRSRDKKVNWQ